VNVPPPGDAQLKAVFVPDILVALPMVAVA
jgi:hypothetical protein